MKKKAKAIKEATKALKKEKHSTKKEKDIKKKIEIKEEKEKDEKESSNVSSKDIEQDDNGSFIDVPAKAYKDADAKIKSTLDSSTDLKIDGMTEDDMKEKEQKEAFNLKELIQKEKELKDANENIHKAEDSIEKEKMRIDEEIK